MTGTAKQYIPLGYRIIGVLKIISALLLACLAFGIFRHLDADWGNMAEHFVHRLHLAPQSHVIAGMLAWASGVDARQMREIGAGTLFYALLYITEGVGILLGCHWAEYLIIIATASLLPLELYEVAKKPDAMRIALLLVNLAIVAYLVVQMRRNRRHRQPPAATPSAPA